MGSSSDDETDDAGAAIPDLDEVVEEDMAMAVADAPSVAVNRVATYKGEESMKYRKRELTDVVQVIENYQH